MAKKSNVTRRGAMAAMLTPTPTPEAPPIQAPRPASGRKVRTRSLALKAADQLRIEALAATHNIAVNSLYRLAVLRLLADIDADKVNLNELVARTSRRTLQL